MELIFIILGYFGSAILSLSYVPQVIKGYKKDNDMKGVSFKFIILQLITTVLFIIYSCGFFMDNSWDGMPIFVANCWVLICLLLLFFRKVKMNGKINEIHETKQ